MSDRAEEVKLTILEAVVKGYYESSFAVCVACRGYRTVYCCVRQDPVAARVPGPEFSMSEVNEAPLMAELTIAHRKRGRFLVI